MHSVYLTFVYTQRARSLNKNIVNKNSFIEMKKNTEQLL